MTEKKDKILFWFTPNFVNFGISKFLQEKYDCDLFAIFDCNNNLKEYLQNQNLVKFEKQWFYRDHVTNLKLKYDLTYLSNFEKKYKINLWNILYSERFFHQYNKYYNFNRDEILSILENECKLLDAVLEDVNPDFAIIKGTDEHQNHLLHELCISKGIDVLTIGTVRFADRTLISRDLDKIDDLTSNSELGKKFDNIEDLQNYMKEYSSQISTVIKKGGLPSFSKRLQISFQYLSLIRNNQNYHAYKGRHFTKLISKNILYFLKSCLRKSFLDNNCKKTIETDIKYIYFPLHLEPERILSIGAPYYTNQLEVVLNIAKSIPIDYKLYVKDHPMTGKFGWRNISYYKQLIKLPNVELIHPYVSNDDLIKNCSLVTTIAGTAGLEAAFLGKPSVVFSDVIYSSLPSVFRIENIEELPNKILVALKTKVNVDDLINYVNLIQQNTFEFDLRQLWLDSFDDLWHERSLDINLTESKMKNHFEKHKKEYEQLVDEHLKKIFLIKQKKN